MQNNLSFHHLFFSSFHLLGAPLALLGSLRCAARCSLGPRCGLALRATAPHRWRGNGGFTAVFSTHIAAVGVPANGRTRLPITCPVLPLVGGDANKGNVGVNG